MQWGCTLVASILHHLDHRHHYCQLLVETIQSQLKRPLDRNTKVLLSIQGMNLLRDQSLKDARNDLPCCCICAERCNDAEHSCPTVKSFCFRCHFFKGGKSLDLN